VVWSDGEPFTANDVVFTWKWVTDPNNNSVTAGVWETVENIEAQDDLTLAVTFVQPSAAWFDPFTGGNNGHIYPAHYWNDDPTDTAKSDAFQLKPMGTGPFMVEEFSPNDAARYVMNENYRHENKPAFASIELKGGGDAPAAARSVLQTGEYDYAWNLQVEPDVLASMLGEDSPGELKIIPGTSFERIHLNFSDPNTEVNGQRSEINTPHPFLTDPAVREALNMAIDRELIASTLYGQGQPATSNVLGGLEAFESPNTSWTFDLDAANKVLEDAGWVMDGDIRAKDGVRLEGTYATSVNPVRQKTQAIVKASLAQIGVDVTLEQIDAGIYFDSAPGNDQNINHFYWDINMYTNEATSSVPIAYMEDWYAGPDNRNVAQKENDWTGTNRQRWINADYDAAFEAMLAATTLEEASELLIQMNDIVIEDRAVIPLVNRAADVYGISKTLYDENVALGVGFEYNYWNVANWNRKAE
jgi:peptide/nickel transport system substrate-binding protein